MKIVYWADAKTVKETISLGPGCSKRQRHTQIMYRNLSYRIKGTSTIQKESGENGSLCLFPVSQTKIKSKQKPENKTIIPLLLLLEINRLAKYPMFIFFLCCKELVLLAVTQKQTTKKRYLKTEMVAYLQK